MFDYNVRQKQRLLDREGIHYGKEELLTKPVVELLPDRSFYKEAVERVGRKVELFSRITNLYQCPRCKAKEAIVEERHLRGLDEASSLLLTCQRCGNVWTR